MKTVEQPLQVAASEQKGLADVVLTATRSPIDAAGAPASVSVVSERDLARRAVVRLGDALADVPGVYVRGAAFGPGFPGSGQAVLSVRGVPRTPRTLVMIDGQPINNAMTGGVNVAGVGFEGVERVEVVRGPYSALYGGAAMGGVINFISVGPDQPLAQVRAGAGSLGQRSASAAFRRRFENGLGITASLGYRESTGYADGEYVVKTATSASGANAVTGARATTTPDGTPGYWLGTKGARPWNQENVQLALHYGQASSTRVVAGFALAQYRIGYSRPDTYLRDASGAPVFSGAVGFDDGGARKIALNASDFLTTTPSFERDIRLFTRVEHRFDGGAVLKANLGQLRHRFDYAQAVSGVSTYDAGAGEYNAQPNQRTDVDVSLRTPMSSSWALTSGIALNRSTLDRSTMSTSYWRDPGTASALLSSGRGSIRGSAVFAQSEHELSPGLVGYLGGRYDRYDTDGEVSQATAPSFTQSYGSRRFGHFSPKLALVWEARASLALRASYGGGFRPPALLDLYSRTATPGSVAGTVSVNEAAPNLKPERVRSFEVGADITPAPRVNASVSLYSQRLDDLIYRHKLSSTLSRTENAGEARIDGVEASLRMPAGVSGVRAFGSLTHQFRYAITRNDAVPASVGKVLTDVPRTSWSMGLDADLGEWTGLLAVRHVGHVFGSGDDANANTAQGVFGSYDAYTTVAAKVGWRYDRRLALTLAADNLTNRRYFVFNRQPGRTLFAEVAYRFD